MKIDWKVLRENKKTRTILLCLFAFALLVAVWRVFFSSKAAGQSVAHTEREERLMGLLCELDGVKDANVLITTDGETALSVIIVFAGEDSILLRIRIIEIAAAATDLPKEKIQLYCSGEKLNL